MNLIHMSRSKCAREHTKKYALILGMSQDRSQLNEMHIDVMLWNKSNDNDVKPIAKADN